MAQCQDCGATVHGGKFCPECGIPLDVEVPAAEVRKTVTVVFCDVVGSTALGERLDPEAQRAVITRYFAEMRRVLELHGGRVEKFIGDAVMALFGVPVVHEDDALRAVRAAFGMQAALRDLSAELSTSYGVDLQARIGVNTGEVVVGDGSRGTVATGDAVNTAARLEQAAGAGEVLLGEPTYRLVREIVVVDEVPAVQAKGKAAAVRAWRLVEAPEGTGRVERTGADVPFVGRQRELRLLREGYDRAVEERICQLVTVLGVAGTGKTRLVQEFLAQLPTEARVLHGRCLSYGDGIVFWPLTEILRAAAGLHGDEDDSEARRCLAGLLASDADPDWVVERLAPIAGLAGRATSAEETHVAVRRLIAALAAERPLVLVLDDLHWAESAMLDLLDDVVDLTRDVPVVLVCSARPEFQELRVGWGSRALNAATVHLSPLGDDDVTQLVGELLPDSPVDPEFVATIAAASGGNALFVGQLVAMLRDDGRLRRVGGVWAVEGALDRLDLPPSISALLAARLGHLPPDERAVLEAASVMGTVFYAGAVPALMSRTLEAPPSRLLTNLLRRDLVRQAQSDISGEEGYRFLHVLVRETAYAALPKAERARLHELFARWLDERADRASGELDEFVGYHLEQAYQLRRELAPPDDATTSIGEHAADRLAAAARSLLIVAPRSAATFYRRAADLVPIDARWVRLVLSEAQALYDAGDFPAAIRRATDAHDEAKRLGDDELEVTAWLDREVIGDQLGEAGDLDERLRIAAEAEARWGTRGSPELTLAIVAARLLAANLRGRWQQVGETAAQGVTAALALGNPARAESFRSYVIASLAHGPMPAAMALQRYDELVAESGDEIAFASNWLAVKASLLAMVDRRDEAQAAIAEALERLGAEPGRNWEPICLGHVADAYEILGDRVNGMRYYGRGVSWLEAHGEVAWLSTYGAQYAYLYLDEIGVDEARRLLEIARAGTAAEDVLSQALVRVLDASLRYRSGDADEAEALLVEGLAWAERSDQLFETGLCYRAAADMRAAAGVVPGVEEALHRALELFEAKGDLSDARRIRGRLAELSTIRGSA